MGWERRRTVGLDVGDVEGKGGIVDLVLMKMQQKLLMKVLLKLCTVAGIHWVHIVAEFQQGKYVYRRWKARQQFGGIECNPRLGIAQTASLAHAYAIDRSPSTVCYSHPIGTIIPLQHVDSLKGFVSAVWRPVYSVIGGAGQAGQRRGRGVAVSKLLFILNQFSIVIEMCAVPFE